MWNRFKSDCLQEGLFRFLFKFLFILLFLSLFILNYSLFWLEKHFIKVFLRLMFNKLIFRFDLSNKYLTNFKEGSVKRALGLFYFLSLVSYGKIQMFWRILLVEIIIPTFGACEDSIAAEFLSLFEEYPRSTFPFLIPLFKLEDDLKFLICWNPNLDVYFSKSISS